MNTTNESSVDLDILNWKDGMREYSSYVLDTDKSPYKFERKKMYVLEKWKSREVYALIKGALGLEPNGMMTKLIRGKPMNNLWWWDFVITNGDSILNVMCSNSMVEIVSLTKNKKEKFDIDKFLEFNMMKYSNQITLEIQKYEIHDSYINHYRSYKRISEHLLKEIKSLNLDKPPMQKGGGVSSAESKQIIKSMKRYTNDSIKFHALGKGMVLNCAFMAESYISILIKVGSHAHSNEKMREVKTFNRHPFEYKLRNLYKFCDGFIVPIDTSVQPIQDMLKVMTLRNKYVHSDFTSQLNMLEPAYFDGDYPLLDSPNRNFIVDSIEAAFHKPDLKTVLECHRIAERFIEYMNGIILLRKKEHFAMILELNIITQNRMSHRFSLIHQQEVQLAIAGRS